MKLLQSQPKLIEIETRLNKQSYLSRGNLPGSADARMFLFLQSIKRYPDRKIYPNFYHWYILMRQFAISSLQKWISNGEYLEQDQLIGDFITRQNEKMALNDTQLLFKKGNNNNIISETMMMMEDSNYTKATILQSTAANNKQGQQTILANPNTTTNCHELEYIMDVKIKEGTKSNMRELVTDFLYNQQVQSPDIQELLQQRRVRIVAKMDVEKYEQLKNKISALEGVETFESKKKDKRFMTNNSTNNFLLAQLN